ncbi:DUF5652 family protein [Candidatus Parcubacteria bacterium]|nr:DUF5652 family protein [Candidatus Parcubacteria bacterium]
MNGDYGPINSSWGGHEWWFAHLPIIAAILSPIIIFVVVWTIFWKGLALWHSARRGQCWWFLILMFVNTLGILEIIYLFGVAKLKLNELFSTKVHHNN